MNTQEVKIAQRLFTGGGELGALMMAKDWSKTSLGDVEEWPQSLKTCVRIILTSSQPMFVWWGKDLINLYNDAYCAILGGKHPDVLGKPAAVVWAEIWDDLTPRVEKAMLHNVGTYDESLLLIMERNGYPEETYYTFSYSPVPGDDGHTAGIICANTDDTQRIVNERQLRTLRDLGRNILNFKDNKSLFSAAIKVLRENAADFPFACLYEIADHGKHAHLVDCTGPDLSHLFPNLLDLSLEDTPWHLPLVIQSGKTAVARKLRTQFTSIPSGPWQLPPDEAFILPIQLSGHEYPSAVLVVGLNPYRPFDDTYQSFFQLVADQLATGISNIHAYEAERLRAEALAAIDQAKTAFFSNVSHEFRTPLTLMLGPLENLLHQPAESLLSDHTENIAATHRNALRLLRLVNSLLDFSRIEAGRTQAQFSPVALGSFTADLASNFRSVIETAGLAYDIYCEPQQEPVYVDMEMWEKIVLNLLSNAFKYTLHGKIVLTLNYEQDQAVLRVIDTGVGIPASELPHMFERFHRVEQSNGRTHEGTGIGLSLVKELVKFHEGDIHVSSVPGKGSIFTVSIPLGTAHLPANLIISTPRDYNATLPEMFVREAMSVTGSELTISQTSTPAIDTLHMPDAHVLVVDDNADMRAYIQRLLQTHVNVTTAVNGQDAVEKIAQQRPDLVITDIMMPVMDGIELLHAIKNNALTADTPVILLSARAGEEAKIEGYDIGADDYLVKPFSSKELFARVRSQLKLTKARQHTTQQLQNNAQELEQRVTQRTSELKQANEALTRTNQELEQFAYVSSHDLQEPLRKIQTFSDLMLHNAQKPGFDTNKYLEKINEAAARMSSLIIDLLSFSRLAKTEEQFEPTDLEATLKNVRSDFEVSIRQKGAIIESDPLPVINAIPVQMLQLFSNLIGNSLKFSDKAPHIKIHAAAATPEQIALQPTLHADKRYLRLEFSDNGIGFDQAYAEQIFTIFQRLHDRKTYQGTGIGLAICKKIVAYHCGTITAHATPENGACFIVYLPW